MAVRTNRLVIYHAVLGAGADVALATVPVGERWILKDLAVTNTGALSTLVALYVVSGPTSAAYWFETVAASQTRREFGRFVVALAGDVLRLNNASPATLDVLLSGTRLEL